MTTTLSQHPIAAKRTPPYSTNETNRLRADLQATGRLLEPIVLYEGTVLDGWHRYQLCLELGIEPIFTEFQGDHAAALALVDSKLFAHRDQYPDWLAWYSVEFDLPEAEARAKARQGWRTDLNIPLSVAEGSWGEATEEVAAKRGLRPHWVKRALALKRRRLDLYQRVGERDITIGQAMEQHRRECRRLGGYSITTTTPAAPKDGESWILINGFKTSAEQWRTEVQFEEISREIGARSRAETLRRLVQIGRAMLVRARDQNGRYVRSA